MLSLFRFYFMLSGVTFPSFSFHLATGRATTRGRKSPIAVGRVDKDSITTPIASSPPPRILTRGATSADTNKDIQFVSKEAAGSKSDAHDRSNAGDDAQSSTAGRSQNFPFSSQRTGTAAKNIDTKTCCLENESRSKSVGEGNIITEDCNKENHEDEEPVSTIPAAATRSSVDQQPFRANSEDNIHWKREPHSLFIGGVPDWVTENDLRALLNSKIFHQSGRTVLSGIKSLKVYGGRGKPFGFAFVTFTSAKAFEHLRQCVEWMPERRYYYKDGETLGSLKLSAPMKMASSNSHGRATEDHEVPFFVEVAHRVNNRRNSRSNYRDVDHPRPSARTNLFPSAYNDQQASFYDYLQQVDKSVQHNQKSYRKMDRNSWTMGSSSCWPHVDYDQSGQGHLEQEAAGSTAGPRKIIPCLDPGAPLFVPARDGKPPTRPPGGFEEEFASSAGPASKRGATETTMAVDPEEADMLDIKKTIPRTVNLPPGLEDVVPLPPPSSSSCTAPPPFIGGCDELEHDVVDEEVGVEHRPLAPGDVDRNNIKRNTQNIKQKHQSNNFLSRWNRQGQTSASQYQQGSSSSSSCYQNGVPFVDHPLFRGGDHHDQWRLMKQVSDVFQAMDPAVLREAHENALKKALKTAEQCQNGGTRGVLSGGDVVASRSHILFASEAQVVEKTHKNKEKQQKSTTTSLARTDSSQPQTDAIPSLDKNWCPRATRTEEASHSHQKNGAEREEEQPAPTAYQGQKTTASVAELCEYFRQKEASSRNKDIATPSRSSRNQQQFLYQQYAKKVELTSRILGAPCTSSTSQITHTAGIPFQKKAKTVIGTMKNPVDVVASSTSGRREYPPVTRLCSSTGTDSAGRCKNGESRLVAPVEMKEMTPAKTMSPPKSRKKSKMERDVALKVNAEGLEKSQVGGQNLNSKLCHDADPDVEDGRNNMDHGADKNPRSCVALPSESEPLQACAERGKKREKERRDDEVSLSAMLQQALQEAVQQRRGGGVKQSAEGLCSILPESRDYDQGQSFNIIDARRELEKMLVRCLQESPEMIDIPDQKNENLSHEKSKSSSCARPPPPEAERNTKTGRSSGTEKNRSRAIDPNRGRQQGTGESLALRTAKTQRQPQEGARKSVAYEEVKTACVDVMKQKEADEEDPFQLNIVD